MIELVDLVLVQLVHGYLLPRVALTYWSTWFEPIEDMYNSQDMPSLGFEPRTSGSQVWRLAHSATVLRFSWWVSILSFIIVLLVPRWGIGQPRDVSDPYQPSQGLCLQGSSRYWFHIETYLRDVVYFDQRSGATPSNAGWNWRKTPEKAGISLILGKIQRKKRKKYYFYGGYFS